MKRFLTPHIALRLMRRRRSQGAVGIIALVALIGVAIAVAAIICVLSVFNGFREILTQRSDSLLPDIEILPASGNILNADSVIGVVEALKSPDILLATDVVSDRALAIFGAHEMPVRLYAANFNDLRNYTGIDSILFEGSSIPSDSISLDDTPQGIVSIGLASALGASARNDVIFIFAPKRIGTIDPNNLATSFVTDSVAVCGIFQSGDENFDKATIFLPKDVARPLFMLDDSQATSVALKLSTDADHDKIAGTLGKLLPDCQILTRNHRQQIAFRMVNIEKWVTFLLLIFILLIASFNIISAMTMFVIEKNHDIFTLRALGMSRLRIGRIFAWQSIFVTIAGSLSGIIIGLALTLGQQHYGWISIGNDSIPGAETLSYPVVVNLLDIPLMLIPVACIGLIAARIAASFARSRIDQTHQ